LTLTENDQTIQAMLVKIMGKLERIEEKLDESIYPPETSIKPDYRRRVKSIETSVAEGTCVRYGSMDDFLKSIRE
jgi:hypothetical protein